MNNNNNFKTFLQKTWVKITFTIGAITALINFIVFLIEFIEKNTELYILILSIAIILFLLLACIYYGWIWKPELEDQRVFIPDSNEQESAQQVKEKQRKKVRRLAKLGLVIIPILVGAGITIRNYYISLPPKDFIILVAKFDGPEPKKYRVTENIQKNLENKTEKYSPYVKINVLDKSLNKDNVREQGKLEKAAIVIWGWYTKTNIATQVSINFEIIKSFPELPQLGLEARGKIQTLAATELESFKLQIRLSQEMAYLSLFTLGMYHYLEEDFNNSSCGL